MAKWNPESILKKLEEDKNKQKDETNFKDFTIMSLKIIGFVIIGLFILLAAIAIILLIYNLFLKLISEGEEGSDFIIMTVAGGIGWVVVIGLFILYVIYKMNR